MSVIESAGYGQASPATGYGTFSIYQNRPEILLQAEIIQLGDSTDDGKLILAIKNVWQEIYQEIEKDPNFLFYFSKHPRKFEEFIAGSYQRDGWPQVELTPYSGDGGRDIIATRPGFCSVRILEQTKAYGPCHLVNHDDIRAMLGVLATDTNSSKAIITTTSNFQPNILNSDEFKRFIPHRLELINGEKLSKRLRQCTT